MAAHRLPHLQCTLSTGSSRIALASLSSSRSPSDKARSGDASRLSLYRLIEAGK